MFVLINPASPDLRKNSFPLGLAYIAGAMKTYGQVRVFDLHCRTDEDALVDCLIQENVLFVGITACSDHFYEVSRLARLVKIFAPHVLVGIGGPHVTYQSMQVLERYYEIDMTLIGSGELAAERLAENLFLRKKDWFEGVPNIAYRISGGQIVFSDYQSPEYSVRPARELFPPIQEYADIHNKDVPILSIDTSRGCLGTCTFCMLKVDKQPRWRCRDVKDFAEELSSITQALDEKSIDLYFTDADIFASVKRLPSILQEVKKNSAIRHIIASARTDSVCNASQYLEEFFGAGLSILELGIESAAQSQLMRYGKHTLVDQHEQALELLLPLEKKYHAKIGIDLIPFDPFVTISELQETALFMEKFFYGKAGYEEGLFIKTTLFPGTELHTQALKSGLISNDCGGVPSYWKFQNEDSAQAFRKVSGFSKLVYPNIRKYRKQASEVLTNIQSAIDTSDYLKFLRNLRLLNELPYQAFHQAVFGLEESAGEYLQRIKSIAEDICSTITCIIEKSVNAE